MNGSNKITITTTESYIHVQVYRSSGLSTSSKATIKCTYIYVRTLRIYEIHNTLLADDINTTQHLTEMTKSTSQFLRHNWERRWIYMYEYECALVSKLA